MKLSYLVQVFSPEALTPAGREHALTYARNHLSRASATPDGILKVISALVSPPCPERLLVFILVNEDSILQMFLDNLSSQAPSAKQEPTVHCKLAIYLRSFMLSLPSDEGQLPPAVLKCNGHVPLLEAALEALSSFDSWQTSPEGVGNNLSSQSRKSKPHKAAPKGKQGRSNPTMTDRRNETFCDAGEKVPRTSEDAEAVRLRLDQKFRAVLKVYLSALKTGPIQKWGNSWYLQSVHAQSSGTTSQFNSQEPTELDGMAYGTTESAEGETSRAARFLQDNIDGLGEWNIDMSSRALHDLRQHSSEDAAIFGIVEKKIRELSHGFFSESNQTKIAGGINEVPVFKARMTGDLRLIYQVDCKPVVTSSGGQSDYEIQQIRILAVCHPKELNRPIWAAIASHSKQRDPEYRRRCNWREIPRIKTKGQNVTPPAVFSKNSQIDDFFQPTKDEISLSDDDFVELHEILSLAKFIPYSPTLLAASQDSASDSSYAFSTSPRENEVISHPSSCLVIGRSGTGKTTTMMFRMLDRELEAKRRGKPIRQVFVTQSRMLASRVQEYFQQVSDATSATSAGPKVDKKSVLTLDLDDHEDEDVNIPQRYSELQDQHFPLFLTFDRLCTLLERDYEERPPQVPGGRLLMTVTGAASRREFISFPIFLSTIWPHFDSRLTKGLDPALVFNEFMGVISGSEQSLDYPEGYITVEAYESLSDRTRSTFASNRRNIYSLFRTYLKHKSQIFGIDAPERTRLILANITNKPPASKFDFLYVDEAQDNSIADAQLLRLLCRNPHGQVWCGDTAQTIAVGSSFRFDDLKSFLFRAETKDPLVVQGTRKPVQPAFFQLFVNYRSHGGIVNAAASVVRIISKLFPHAIDTLATERGLVSGPRPVFLYGRGPGFSLRPFFASESGKFVTPGLVGLADGIEEPTRGPMLGADQAILVRNEDAREALLKDIGEDIGLILTLYESKGLEFDDVILYNFFADSATTATDWRHAIGAFDALEGSARGTTKHDESHFASIQSELKFLYVGLTRARKRVWIWDGSDKADALRELWLRRDLITLCHPSTGADLPFLYKNRAINSDAWKNRWRDQGRELFNSKQFAHAAFCFKQAQMMPEMELATAFDLRRIAFALSKSDATRTTAMRKAGTALRDCAKAPQLASERRSLSLRAAEAFFEAREYLQAAQMFEDAGSFQDAAVSYRKAGSFSDAVRIVRGNKVSADVAESIIDTAKIVFTKNRETRAAKDLFENEQEHLDFLEDLGFDAQRFNILRKSSREGRFEEMAEICFQNNENIKGFGWLLQSPTESTRKQALHRLWGTIWSYYPLGSTLPKDSAYVGELLGLVQKAPLSSLEHSHVNLVKALEGDRTGLRTIANDILRAGDTRAALLAYDTLLRDTRETAAKETDHGGIMDLLQDVRIYAELVRRISGEVISTLIDERDWQALLALSVPGNSSPGTALLSKTILVLPHSVLYSEASGNRASKIPSVKYKKKGKTLRTEVAHPEVDRLALAGMLRKFLLRRANSILWDIHQGFLHHKNLRVCHQFATLGLCPSSDCDRQHIPRNDLSVEDFNRRAQAHLTVILALDNLVIVNDRRWSDDTKTRRNIQGTWLERLFETFYPPMALLGSLSNLRPDLVPEIEEAMVVVRRWTQDKFMGLKPPLRSAPQPWPYLTEILTASLLGSELDGENALHYMARGQWKERNPLPLTLEGEFPVGRPPTPLFKNVLSWYFGDSLSNVSFGIQFLWYVVERGLDMDLNVLAHLIEMISVHVVVSAQSSANGTLVSRTWKDPVTLPCSLLLRSFSWTPGYVELRQVELLVEIITILSRRLTQSNRGYTFLVPPVVGRAVGVAEFWERNVVILRLCQCLIIVGQNIVHESLRELILSALSFSGGLREEPTELSCFLATLAQPIVVAARASDWAGVVEALGNSGTHSSLDEVVTVSSEPPAESSVTGFPSIQYETEEDLYFKLTERTQVVQNGGSLGAKIWRKATTQESQIDLQLAEVPRDSEVHVTVEETKERRIACIRIQIWYRLQRQKVTSPRNAPGRFEECLAALNGTRETPFEISGGYKLRFLGPLPYILAYLEELMHALQEHKAQINKRIKTAQHDALEELRKEQKALTRLIKDTRDTSKELGPTSTFHQARSISGLEAVVERITRLKEMAEGVLKPSMEDEVYEIGAEEYKLGVEFMLPTAEKSKIGFGQP